MGIRTTMVLALALALASVGAWIDMRNSPAPSGTTASGEERADGPPGESITRLLSFSAAAIKGITLQHGAVNARLTRTDDGWEGTSHPGAVDDFLRSLQDLAQIMVVGPEGGTPRDYGLDPPAAVVHLERAGDAPIELRLGSPNPTSTGVYAQIGAAGPVVVTGALAQWELDKIVRALQETRNATAPADVDNVD